jgi:hypothetical protein
VSMFIVAMIQRLYLFAVSALGCSWRIDLIQGYFLFCDYQDRLIADREPAYRSQVFPQARCQWFEYYAAVC